MALTTEETKQAMIERLVDELDPRNRVATRAFFELLRPDVRDTIGDFYNPYNRLLIEVALKLRDIDSTLVEQATLRTDKEAFSNQAHELVGTLYPGQLEGWEEVNPMLTALRADLDEGILTEMDGLSLTTSQSLLTDEGWEEQIRKQVELTSA
jgi:hypothetical protein